MFRLFRYLKGYKKEVILGPLFKLLEAVLELIVPLLMAKMIDDGIPEVNESGSYRLIIILSILIIILTVIGLVSALICQYYASVASQGFGTVLRNETYLHINTLPNEDIDKLGASSLVNRLGNDVNQMQLAVAMTIRLLLRSPFLVIGSTIMAIIIDVKIGLIFIGATIIIGVILFIIMRKNARDYRIIQTDLDDVGDLTRDNLVGSRVIKAFSTQERETKKFNDSTERLYKNSMKVSKVSALLNPITYIITNIAIILILFLGSNKVNSGSLKQGEILALINYMMHILLAMTALANLVVILTKAGTSAVRINQIFDTIPQAKAGIINDGIATKMQIKCQNISFSYRNHLPTIHNLNMIIYQNQTIGIIGLTGSGKSTIVSLIARHLRVTEGQLFLNGININEYTDQYLQQTVGVVMQKAVLFSGTIRKNMCMKNKMATDEDIWQALQAACADDFIQSLDQELVALGKNFSGGQRQRIAIAQIIVAKPAILILDDSLSALDLATEAKVRQNIKAYLPTSTIIIVTQRINAIRNADNIYVIDEGRICGTGTHQQLLNDCELYQNIYHSQKEVQ